MRDAMKIAILMIVALVMALATDDTPLRSGRSLGLVELRYAP
jgi:hypothetical protein